MLSFLRFSIHYGVTPVKTLSGKKWLVDSFNFNKAGIFPHCTLNIPAPIVQSLLSLKLELVGHVWHCFLNFW